MSQIQKVWKTAIAASVINLIGMGSGVAMASAQSKIFVTTGGATVAGPIHVNDALGVGREWAVYDLNRRKFVGIANVTGSEMIRQSNCTYSASKNGFVPQATLSFASGSSQSSNLLLIRSASTLPTTAKLRSTSFGNLPRSFQQHLLASVKGNDPERNKKFVRDGEFTTVDLDGDNTPDAIYANIGQLAGTIRSIYTSANSGSGWVMRYKEDCEAAC